MKTNFHHQDELDADLLSVFKETFAGDDLLLNEAIAEAKRALRYVRDDMDWNDMEYYDEVA